MPSDTIPYDVLAREALRRVVHDVLVIARDEGLPGDHHFFITFRTNTPGVSMSDQLKAEFPEEMTIVLQHQYWDLEITPEQFSVKLAFGGVPRELVVPFKAVSAFFDPSVQFGLQFSALASDPAGSDTATDQADTAASEADEADAIEKPDDTPGEVVSLDAFRKK